MKNSMDRFLEDAKKWGDPSRRFFSGIGHAFAGGVGGLLNYTPDKTGMKGFAGNLSYYSTNTLRHASALGSKALVSGLEIGREGLRLGGSYTKARKSAAMDMKWKRHYADSLGDSPRPFASEHGPWGGASGDPYKHHARYGKQKDGYRRFGVRSPGEHLKKAGKNLGMALTSPLGIGINLGLAAYMSEDNIFDPHKGMAKALAENVGAEVGFIGGGALGAAAASFLVPGGPILGAIAAGIGFIGGGIMGADAGSSIATTPWSISSFGSKYGRRSVQRKSQFIDSEGAATMRQRSMESIQRSQMNARSAFGQEALSYHI